jgi:fibronectin-binding autotransporter adhesin
MPILTMMSFASRCLVVFVAAILSVLFEVPASGQTWTGQAAPDNRWTTAGNWNGGVPGSGATVIFNGPGNGNTNISLGGETQPIDTLLFDTPSAAAYTLGQLPGDALAFEDGGLFRVDTTVTTPQVINATLRVNGDLLVTNGVSNGGAMVGDGLVGLTLGPVNIEGGTLFVNNGQATVTTALNGNITDSPGLPGSLSLMSASGGGAANINSNFIIKGNNTYTGGTTIQANTGTNGSVQIGTDMPFGSGKVTNIFQGNSVEFRALGGTRTITNAIDLDGGINFAGTNSFVLDGPIFIKSGVSRTLSNKISLGGTLTLGASPGASTIYLGNPVSNGGDGAGRTIILSATAGTTMYVNALFQDVDPSGADSAVRYGGNATGNIIINTPQTYTSRTILGGGESTVQFRHDYHVGDPSGPFGLGTLVALNAANNQLAPIEGDRTIANPIQMEVGFSVTNIPGDPSSVTFSGPITFASGASRLIQNKMHPTTGGTLTLGSATSPSTITLASTSTTGPVTLTFASTGRTIINDTIQDSPGAPITHIAVNNSSTTTFNGAQNTDGNFTVSGTNATVIVNGTRSGAGNLAVAGSGAKLFVNGSKTGSGAVTINSNSTLAGTGSIDGDVTNNGTIAPGTVAGIPGTLNLTGNVTNNANSLWVIGLAGMSAGKLDIGGNLDLSSVDSLDVIGTGSGSSWLIATYSGTLTGTFDNVAAGYTVDYGTSGQIILNAAAALAGDYNNDGKVDAADYVVWRKDPASHGGDPNGYNTWRQNFGNSSGSGSGAINARGAVPEPATVVLILLANAQFLTWKRRGLSRTT